jgi:endonuclease/exonuclease/phosphatase family metal-dependent hydrolase
MRFSATVGLLFAALAAACAAEPVGTAESEVGSRPERAWTPTAVKEGNLRVATFNIRNFPEDRMGGASPDAEEDPERLVRRELTTDLEMLVELLEKLDFDVLAVQEIGDVEAFDALLERLAERTGRAYDSTFSTAWDHPQNVGIVVRSDRFRLEAPEVHEEIATRPTMRAGLSARVVSRSSGGVDFGVLVLHLASGTTSGRAALRATQAAFAAEAVARRQAEWGDDDFVVVGDLNTAKGELEYPELDEALASHGTGLTREEGELACTSYYTKSPKNPLLQPSQIDHVYLASLEERDPAVPLAVGAHCAERDCEPFESDSAEHGTTYWGVSDHCPVYFEIRDRDLD